MSTPITIHLGDKLYPGILTTYPGGTDDERQTAMKADLRRILRERLAAFRLAAALATAQTAVEADLGTA